MPNLVNSSQFIVNRYSKSLVLLLFIVSGLLFPVQAQTSPLEKAQNDYNFQTSQYKDAHDKYATARSEYLTFKTALSKDKAYQETKNYLIQVDLLYKTFLALVQENTNSLNWDSANVSKIESNNILTTETSFFDDNQKKVLAAQTLEELPPLAKDLKDHVTQSTNLKLNKTLATAEIVQSKSLLFDFNTLSATLDSSVKNKLQEGNTQSVFLNWATENANIKTLASQKVQFAQSEFAKSTTQNMDTATLNNIADSAQSIKVDLQRSVNLFEELLRLI
ncbi:MAG TPA: hypothetical protein VLE91_03740 [Candidatus Saccharimonadales bacterium]|nr:hypothetical protein [Candidatus Saccharimonadales bacterium]